MVSAADHPKKNEKMHLMPNRIAASHHARPLITQHRGDLCCRRPLSRSLVLLPDSSFP